MSVIDSLNEALAWYNSMQMETGKVIFEYFGQPYDKDKILILPERFNIEGFPKSKAITFSKYLDGNEGYAIDRESMEIPSFGDVIA